MTTLEVFGPFKISVAKKRVTRTIGKPQVNKFLELLDEEKLAKKQGCYVFAIPSAKGYVPYYVGKATGAMRDECMGLQQINSYNDALKEGKNGAPAMFIIAQPGSKKAIPKQVCDELETALTQTALIKNPALRSVKKTQRPKWQISGVIRGGRGRPTEGAGKFKSMLSL